ncbi:SURF1 family protein, partial [Methylobacterium trifolii]|uniref:SURF1 family protein n=1 Tax=Methylobacterium trifolii TaxID=1003092 RepID=UPI001EDFB531
MSAAGSKGVVRRSALRDLAAPGIAATVALAILLGLGTWQIQRKGEKETLIARILARSKAEPQAPPAAAEWNPVTDEFRHVRAAGTFENDRETLVHGLAAGETPGRALQGYYVLTPFRRAEGGTLLVNRGFVP